MHPSTAPVFSSRSAAAASLSAAIGPLELQLGSRTGGVDLL